MLHYYLQIQPQKIKIILRSDFLHQFSNRTYASLPKLSQFRIVSLKFLLFFTNSHRVIRVFPETEAHLNVLVTLQNQFNSESVSIILSYK